MFFKKKSDSVTGAAGYLDQPKLKDLKGFGKRWSRVHPDWRIAGGDYHALWVSTGTLILELRKRVKQLELQQSKVTDVL